MPVKNKLAIFDIDGTLTDSVYVHQTAFVSALEKMGMIGFDTNWGNYKHHTDSYIFNAIFQLQYGRDTTKKDIGQFENLLDKHISSEAIARPIQEIKAAKYFLEQLVHNSDFDIVFATGSLLKPAKQKLLAAGIAIHDDLISAANDVFSREELVSEAIEKAKRHYSREDYNQIISFGDGRWDHETAMNLNIDFIGIGNNKLLEYGVTDFFSDFEAPRLSALLNIENVEKKSANFKIRSADRISAEFARRNIFTFYQAMEFVKQLPYKRNKNKNDLTTVFTDGYGTCSTKHALLKQLAIENNAGFVKLKLGIFKMNKDNTPEISGTLAKYNLEFIPEAHNYLLVENEIVDCTKSTSRKEDFINDLISEIEIEPHQITNFKVNIHKSILQEWLTENHNLLYTLPELWAIREKCIGDLQLDQG